MSAHGRSFWHRMLLIVAAFFFAWRATDDNLAHWHQAACLFMAIAYFAWGMERDGTTTNAKRSSPEPDSLRAALSGSTSTSETRE